MITFRSALVLITGVLFLLGCTNGETDRQSLVTQALQSGFAQSDVASAVLPFSLIRPGTTNQPALVIFESDGTSFLADGSPSPDPTPKDPMGYHLAAAMAAAKPGRTVLYVARPCQYLTPVELARCPPNLWLMNRFGREAQRRIESVIQRQLGDQPVVLIGISGGGVIAAHLARQWPTTQKLITIAAPLALNAWAEHHHVTRFDPADDPLGFAATLTAIPQLHIAGVNDAIVPAPYISRFADQSGGDVRYIQRTRHQNMWQAAVPIILQRLGD